MVFLPKKSKLSHKKQPTAAPCEAISRLASHLVTAKPRAKTDASADWKQAVSSATASGRKICQNHFFKNQNSLA